MMLVPFSSVVLEPALRYGSDEAIEVARVSSVGLHGMGYVYRQLTLAV